MFLLKDVIYPEVIGDKVVLTNRCYHPETPIKSIPAKAEGLGILVKFFEKRV